MEKKYSLLNNLTGWSVWLIASVVYILTIEPTASFWDCGEFIAAAHKLQIGHPPGAPTWMMIARVFGLFASDVEGVAAMVNVFSALCSSFSILFLFWSITAIAKKMAVKNGELNGAKIISVIASGTVGALVYTFTDSFWFSAVEAEVYAASSFFTAIVFWLILKWEANADKPFADRYLLIIAYLMGLSIGVHILNLLAIPAIVYVFYFKKYKFSFKGMVYAGVASIILLGIVQKFVISFSVELATKFELFFVNNMGLPYDSGTWIYFVLILSAITFGIIKTAKNNKAAYQNGLIGLLLILIGYSSFAVIVLRSQANPPMDENNPDNIVSLLPYLNREQYGDSPLLYGNTFASELDYKEPYVDGKPVYYRPENQEKDHYEISDKREKSIPNYEEKTLMYFPRMWSTQGHHVRAYEAWSGFEGKRVKIKSNETGSLKTKIVRVPTMGENIQFFLSYQVNFSYWRYFMWNFTGRQNDIQGHGIAGGSDALLNGNWLSGVDFIDNEHLGNQSTLPETMTSNVGRNTFFFLPLILGIFGLVFNFAKNWKDGFVVALLFFMTGLAVILYLNPTPYQPRERDYAYAGSFYAFAIWVGLGVQAIFHLMFNERLTKAKSKEEEAQDNVLIKNGKYEIVLGAAILVAIGIISYISNSLTEAFSLFYIGGVIVAVVVFAALIGKIIKNDKLKALLALAITIPIPYIMATEGWDDHDRSNKYTARDFAKNYLDSCEKNAILFTNGDNDTFPLWYVQDVEGYRTDVRVVNLSLLNTDWYIDQMKRKAYDSDPVPFSLTQDQYRQGTRDYILIQDELKSAQDLNKMMEFVKSDEMYTKKRMMNEVYLDYIPTNSISLPIDTSLVLNNGTVSPQFRDKMVDEMTFNLKGRTLLKAKLLILDLLANNNWERPIYFAITVGGDHYMNLEEYFQLEGLAYRLTPVKHGNEQGQNGGIHIDRMYDNFVNKYNWGNMKEDGVYVGEQSQRMCMNFRSNFARLAKALVKERNDKEKAIILLNKCMEEMPRNKVPYNYFTISVADAYYTAGDSAKGNEIILDIVNQYHQELRWYFDQDEDKLRLLRSEIESANRTISTAAYFASINKQDEVVKEIERLREELDKEFGINMNN